MCVGAVSSSADSRTWQNRRRDAAAARGGGSERENARQRPKDESKTTALAGRAVLPGPKAAWVSATQTGLPTSRMPRPQIVCKATACVKDFSVQHVPRKSVGPSNVEESFGALRIRDHSPAIFDARSRFDYAQSFSSVSSEYWCCAFSVPSSANQR